jgi:hypothetical protein
MSITVLILLQLADAALTLAHSIEELKGRLADYFGAIVGVRIPAWSLWPVRDQWRPGTPRPD